MSDLRVCFLIFITYAFVGWLIEIVGVALLQKKVINRGFLIGPYCPIYGVGAVIMLYFLDADKNDLMSIFLKTMMICALLEYVTSYIMEKLFKTRWWDYSDKKFNINGRICLETMILFGIGGTILVYFMNPLMLSIYNGLPNLLLTIMSILLAIIFITDVVLSLNIINSVKNTFINGRKDYTEEITTKVRKALLNSYLSTRLLKAFPNLKQKTKEK